MSVVGVLLLTLIALPAEPQAAIADTAADGGFTRQRGGFIGSAPLVGGRYSPLDGGSTVRSSVTLINIGRQASPIELAFYRSTGGAPVATISNPDLDPGNAVSVSSGPDPLVSAGPFLTTISGTQPIAGIVSSAPTQGARVYDGYLSPVNLGFVPQNRPELQLWSQTLVPQVYKGYEGRTSALGIGERSGRAGQFRLQFYNPSGVLVTSRNLTLAPLGSAFVDLGSEPGLPPGFVGSAVVIPQSTSAQRLEALVAVRTTVSEAGALRSSDSYSSMARVSRVLTAPALFKGYLSAGAVLNSELCVQNGETRAQRVSIHYSDGVIAEAELAPYAATCFRQADEAHAEGWSGGATIRGSGSIAAAVFTRGEIRRSAPPNDIVRERWSYTVPALAELTRYAFAFIPLASAFTSELYAYNPHDRPVDIRISFSGSPLLQRVRIEPQAHLQLLTAERPTNFTVARVVSSAPIALAVSSAVQASPANPDAYTVYGYEAPYTLADYLPNQISDVAPPPVNPRAGEPADSFYGDQPFYQSLGATAMWRRGVVGAPAGRTITVAVVDTGVASTHPDLVRSLDTGVSLVPDLPTVSDSDGHGTEVAGLIAARRNNGVGVAGIGGGDEAAGIAGLRILPLQVGIRVEETLNCQRVANAVRLAILARAQIINLSLKLESRCSELYEVLVDAHEAGLAIVAGAGNDGASAPVYPAAYGEDGLTPRNERLVIAVCGLAEGGVKHPDSNYGQWVDVCAPYGPLLSTSVNPGYQSIAGTSASTALVSGLLGLLMANDGLTRDQAVERLLNSAADLDGINPDYAGLLGEGAIDARQATIDRDPRVWLPLIRR